MDVKSGFNGAGDPKYELDKKDFIVVEGVKLYRVVALRAFGDVEAGERGGFVESTRHLSQSGNCWVAGRACVRERGRVSKNASYMRYR